MNSKARYERKKINMLSARRATEDCTHSVDLLMTVSPLALALHMLLFVPPCLFPLPVCINR